MHILKRSGTPRPSMAAAFSSDGFIGWPPDAEKRPDMAGIVVAVARLVLICLFTLPSIVVQSVLLLLPGPAKIAYPRFFWTQVRRLLGVRLRLIGRPASDEGSRPVLFVSNHTSWVDVPTLGGLLPACFMAKGEVAGWPVIGIIAKLGRTIFISRKRGTLNKESLGTQARFGAGDNFLLFAEGTTGDGVRVLPFNSSFFGVTQGIVPRPWVQPVSVVYDRLGFLPSVRATMPIFAWYGDMALGPHLWTLAKARGMRVSVLLHPPIDPGDIASRKMLAATVAAKVTAGVVALRQNQSTLAAFFG